MPAGITVAVTNDTPGHPNVATIFDSACFGGCTGGDTDLRTPGTGPGNNQAQRNALIIAENVIDANGDGLVDGPDDEQNGGSIVFNFAQPHKLLSVRVLDIEDVGETPNHVFLELYNRA